MGADTNNILSSQTLTQASAAIASAIKTAKAAQDLAAKAPKAATVEEISKTTALLVEHGWIPKEREEQVKQALADPATALTALQNLAIKAAQELTKDPRLGAGRAIPRDTGRPAVPTTKQAYDDESPADRMYREKIESYLK